MKRLNRAGLLLPLFGLVLLAAAWTSRGLREPGLALEPFPPPADVQLEPVELPRGDAHLRGIVQDADGRPVPEALVKAVAGEEPIWAYTDDLGRFALEGLPPGAHRVLISTRRHHLNELLLQAPAEQLELTLEREFAAIGPLPALVRAPLRGQLVAALSGQDLDGYEVAFRPLAPPQEFGAPIERRALVGPGGGFAIDDLLVGEYRLSVLPPWARGGLWPDLAVPENASYEHARGGSPSALAVRMAAGALFGLVADDRGQPVEGALLLLHPSGAAERPWPPATTDASGAFTLRHLPPGDYELEVRAGAAVEELDVRAEAGRILELAIPPLATRGRGHP